MAPGLIYDDTPDFWKYDRSFQGSVHDHKSRELPRYQSYSSAKIKQAINNQVWQTGANRSQPIVQKDWPLHLDSELAWNRASFNAENQYIQQISYGEVREIELALQYFKDLGLDGDSISSDTFPLPSLKGKLQDAALEVHSKRGFVVLRGLDSNQYTDEDNIIIYLGISSYIAERRGKQDDDGNIFGHVRENKKMTAAQTDRMTTDSTIAAEFHTDMFCDVLAMQCRSSASEGGNHLLASSWNIYNQLAAARPDLVQVLAKGNWAFNTRGRLYQEDPRPLLYFHDGRMILNIVPNALNDPDFKREELTPLQVEALAMIQTLAMENHISLNLQPGDLTFVNNFALLHARQAFRDDENRSRYLVRTWLKNDNLAWNLPLPLEIGNRLTFDADDEIEERWNVKYTPSMHCNIRDRAVP